MSSYIKYIVIIFSLLNSSFAYCAEKVIESPKDIIVENVAQGGQLILDLNEEEAPVKYTLAEKIEIFLSTAKHFDEVLEGDKLEENFTEEIAQVFPGDTAKQLYDKEYNIRMVMRVYRYFKGIFDEVKAKALVPEEPPLIVADEDYDMGYKEEYIEAPKDSFVKIQDFKKVLAYGSNPKDAAAIKAKRKRDIENSKEKTRFEQLYITMSKVDWKKALFDDDFDYSPFTGVLGSGEWFISDNIKVRTLTTLSRIDNQKEFKMVFNFALSDRYFIKASNLKDNSYIKINFNNSKNYKEHEVYYSLPDKIDIVDKEERMLVYGGNFSIPFTLYIEDINKDLELNANINLTLCSLELECHDVELHPSIRLESGEGLNSQYDNYVNKVFSNIPKSKNDKLEIVSLIFDKENSNLRTVVKSKYDISNFDIFIESLDGIELKRPRVAIDGKKMIVKTSLKDSDVDALGKSFMITAANNIYSVRKIVIAEEISIFDIMNETISVPLVLLAVLGGFILNFMPCVFPVLSIKLISLNKIGARKLEEVKKSFYLTTLGIIITFFIIAMALCLVKYLGHSIGWGMQFQSPVFLVCMIFVMTVFVAYVLGVQTIKTPKWLNKIIFKSHDENSLLYFITGVLVVIMATPCTAPYLGTTIGFALAGSYLDIIIILMAISIGLSLPYVFFALFPSFSIYVPKPGSWMDKLNKSMAFMLILTLIWLISIYYAQTNLYSALRVVLYVLFILIVLWFRYLIMIEIESSVRTLHQRRKLKSKFNKIATSLCFLIFSIAMFDGLYNFQQRKSLVMETRENRIDMGLINEYVNDGKIVIINVQADWCLTCKYNDFMVFSNVYMERLIEKKNVKLINIDWTNYDKQILEFMEKYGRKGLPFYILYSKSIPDGMVLPEILTEMELSKIIQNIKD